MENLIKKIRAVEPTKEQLKDRTPEYAFGWVDSLNAITEVVKNNVDLHSVSNQRKLLIAFADWYKTTDFNCEGCCGSDCVDEYLKSNL